MILIPANALSIWRCTLSISDFRNSLHFFGVRKLIPEVLLSNLKGQARKDGRVRIRSVLISRGPEGSDFFFARLGRHSQLQREAFFRRVGQTLGYPSAPPLVQVFRVNVQAESDTLLSLPDTSNDDKKRQRKPASEPPRCNRRR